MTEFSDFLNAIQNPAQRARAEEILRWVGETFPTLARRMAWNQPAFTQEGTFIIAFSLAKQHLAVAPETVTLERFEEDIRKTGYTCTKMLMRIPWNKEVDYPLLKKMIAFNMEDKKGHKAFWRVLEEPLDHQQEPPRP